VKLFGGNKNGEPYFLTFSRIFESTKKKCEIITQSKYSPGRVELWTSLIHSRIDAYLPPTFVVFNVVPYFVVLVDASYF
jgi:hypothetical protein